MADTVYSGVVVSAPPGATYRWAVEVEIDGELHRFAISQRYAFVASRFYRPGEEIKVTVPCLDDQFAYPVDA